VPPWKSKAYDEFSQGHGLRSLVIHWKYNPPSDSFSTRQLFVIRKMQVTNSLEIIGSFLFCFKDMTQVSHEAVARFALMQAQPMYLAWAQAGPGAPGPP